MTEYIIDDMNQADWNQVRRIYEEGIKTGNATFETAVPDWDRWDAGHLKKLRLVARTDNHIQGWAALSPVSDRCVYGGVAEVSVYVSADSAGHGIGTRLLTELIRLSEKAGIWTLQAGIFPENKASIILHKKCGFRIIGTREKLGQMNGVWRDVVMLERRSTKTGI